jgi:Fur family ferric uptake transcriptional regulator
VEKVLKSKKIRVTNFRLTVLDIFNNKDNAISMEEIEHELGSFDRITLYRTIKTFIMKGIIHEIMLPGNVKKLAICTGHCEEERHHHEHLHFQCRSCEEVYCVDLPVLPKIKLKGFKIDSLEIQAIGLCESCA